MAHSKIGALAAGFLLVVALAGPTDANHLNCNQYDGNSGDNTFTGTDSCDEFWMYEGHDIVYAQSNGTVHDDLHMGAGGDYALGQGGADDIAGGDNPTDFREDLYGNDSYDAINDTTGPDWDLECGGLNTDYLHIDDGDGKDTAKGESNDDTHPDQIYSDSGDSSVQDGNC